ncbi:MAG TPA: glycosyltransferase family 9 protein [Acidimicrobiales bacterium]|nr:glycosyltransferase family 9 protein [Acidimicrobiales bacterium]
MRARGPWAPTVVILRALGLGDFLTGVPALRAVARAFPDHRRVLAAPPALVPLVAHVGAVHAVAPTAGLGALPAALGGPEVAIDLHGRGPGSQPLLVALNPRRLVAFAHPAVPATAGGPRWKADEHEVARWCRLLTESGIAADPADLAIRPPGPPPAGAAGATVIHPGAASPARRWPPARFAAVAASERAAGRRVLVTGSATERPIAMAVAEGAALPPGDVIAGQTDLLELASVVAGAGRVVSGDTGVAHLATALGTPSVVLCGPVPPALWGPPPGNRHIALWAGECGDPHGARPHPGLLRISVTDVLAALERLPLPAGRDQSLPRPAY